MIRQLMASIAAGATRARDVGDQLGVRLAEATRPESLTRWRPDGSQAHNWTTSERAEYRRRYLVGDPVPQPFPGCVCEPCATLRVLMLEADDEDRAAAAR